MGKRLQQRISIAAQLVKGQDDDLINWLEKPGAASRNQAIKNTLRAGLGLKPVAYGKVIELDSVREEIETLRGTVTQLPALVQKFSPANGEIQKLRSDLEAQFQHIEQWLNYLNDRVEKLASADSTPAPVEVSTPAPAPVVEMLNDQEEQQRATRLRKNKW